MRTRTPGNTPAHLSAAAGYPNGRSLVWAKIRELRDFALGELETATEINQATLRSYVQGLTNAGFLSKDDRPAPLPGVGNRHRPARWTLVNDVGVEAPRVNRAGDEIKNGQNTENMWRTMKIIGDFSVRDLAVQSSTEECVVKESHAKTYCRMLMMAGYLAVTQYSRGGRPKFYRFLRSKNSGPVPPVVQREKQVFDPNLNKIVWSRPGVQEMA